MAVLGIRPQDEYRIELQAAGIAYRAVPELRSDGAARSAQWARQVLQDCDGYWVHIDVDVLDPAVMPAVDAPDPGGIAYAELELLLAGLVNTSRCLGVELTVFDPDYDPDGQYAEELVEMLVTGLAPVGAAPVDGPGSATGSRRARVPIARSTFADFAPSPRHSPEVPAPRAAPPRSAEPTPATARAPETAPQPTEAAAHAPEETLPAPEATPEATTPAPETPEPAPPAAPEPVTVPTQPGPPDEPRAPRRQVDHGPGKLRRRPPT